MYMYMYLEVVDGDKVREEWENVLNLENAAVLQELHCSVTTVTEEEWFAHKQ